MRRLSHKLAQITLLTALLSPVALLGGFGAASAWASPPEHAAEGHDGGHGEDGEGEHGAGEHHEASTYADLPGFFNWPNEEDPRPGLGFLLINFAVLLGLLEVVLFRNLRGMHAEKRAAIKDQLDKASAARKEAEKIIAEYRGKVDSLDEEVESLMSQAEKRAKDDYARIVEEAKVEAEKIKAAARAQAEREAKMRVAKIEAEVVDQALAAAEKALRQQFGAAEQRKAIDDYVSEIGDADLTQAS